MKIGMFLGSVGSDSGGPERHEIELVKSLAAIDKNNEYHLLCLFNKGPERLIQQENFSIKALGSNIRVLSMLTSLPYNMKKIRADLWHATYIPPPFSPCDYIFTLVCSSMFERPELYPPGVRFRLLALTERAIKKAKLIICISEHIKQVVQERYGVADDRLAVVYLGVSESFRPIEDSICKSRIKDLYGIQKPYFLFSGRWEPRKNIIRIIQAFARFKQQSQSDIQLVFTGERTWMADEADKIIRELKLENDIIDLGKSAVEELPFLYSGAVALVYPSLWEGFGFPIVEGMAAGVPVITSDNSSMAEVGAGAARFVNPLSVESIAEAMYELATDTELRTSLRERGLQRARIFNWHNTAVQTLNIYEKMVNPDH